MVGVRPESMELAGDGIPAFVKVVEELGADAFVFAQADFDGPAVKLVARVDARRRPVHGEDVRLRPRLEDAHLFHPARVFASMPELKVTVFGGASTYTPELMEGIPAERAPAGREMALMDIDADRLAVVGGFAGRMAEAAGWKGGMVAHDVGPGGGRGGRRPSSSSSCASGVRPPGFSTRRCHLASGPSAGDDRSGRLARALRTVPVVL